MLMVKKVALLLAGLAGILNLISPNVLADNMPLDCSSSSSALSSECYDYVYGCCAPKPSAESRTFGIFTVFAFTSSIVIELPYIILALKTKTKLKKWFLASTNVAFKFGYFLIVLPYGASVIKDQSDTIFNFLGLLGLAVISTIEGFMLFKFSNYKLKRSLLTILTMNIGIAIMLYALVSIFVIVYSQ